ncbi:MAG: hypothetical protein GY822_30655 [Deltaproteobacteria bacterium]|nr:hypothetical protein [Deltaproteobacteria bacterium]
MNALRASCIMSVFFSLLFSTTSVAQYTESVTFSFRSDEVTYQGPLTTAYLMLDVEGGRNRVNNAQLMNCAGSGPTTCSLTVDLEEGNYIYVFVANANQFVDLNDVSLNHDDIPDSNFFRDASPRDVGFCGQFSTDNCLFVRNPDRPTFAAPSFSPGHGALATTSSVTMSIDVKRGANNVDIGGATVRAYFEEQEPALTRYSVPDMPAQLVEIDLVNFTPNGTGGVLSAVFDNPPEGFHRVFFDVSSAAALAAERYETAILINRDNAAPTANAGATLFAAQFQEVVLDATLSLDPDRIVFRPMHGGL